MIGITQDQIRESIAWIICTQFNLKRIEPDSEEFCTLSAEGIYGYHTLGIIFHDLSHIPMEQKYGTASLLIMDECDHPRLVTLADHKGNVALGFFELVPFNECAYKMLHLLYELWSQSTLSGAIKAVMPNLPAGENADAYPMPFELNHA